MPSFFRRTDVEKLYNCRGCPGSKSTQAQNIGKLMPIRLSKPGAQCSNFSSGLQLTRALMHRFGNKGSETRGLTPYFLRLLEASPELARQAVIIGATRQVSTDYYFDETDETRGLT